MIVLDTNVLLYFIGGPHPLREPCRHLVEAIGRGDVDAHLTDVVVAEFLHARARRTSRGEAAARAADLIAATAGVLAQSDAARARALMLFTSSERLSSNDAMIAAVALEHGATLVSADRDFADVPGLQILVPGTPALKRLVG